MCSIDISLPQECVFCCEFVGRNDFDCAGSLSLSFNFSFDTSKFIHCSVSNAIENQAYRFIDLFGWRLLFIIRIPKQFVRSSDFNFHKNTHNKTASEQQKQTNAHTQKGTHIIHFMAKKANIIKNIVYIDVLHLHWTKPSLANDFFLFSLIHQGS